MKSQPVTYTPAPLRALFKIEAGIQFNPEAREIVIDAWEGRDVIAPMASETRRGLLAAAIVSALLSRAKGETALILAPSSKEAQKIFRTLHTLGNSFQLTGMFLSAETLLSGSVRQSHDFVVTTAGLFGASREALSAFLPRVTCLVLCGYERLKNITMPCALLSVKEFLAPNVQTIIALDEYEPESFDFDPWSVSSETSSSSSTHEFAFARVGKLSPVALRFARP